MKRQYSELVTSTLLEINAKFNDKTFPPGHILTHAWLQAAAGHAPYDLVLVEDMARYRLGFLEPLKDRCLEEHSLWLRRVHGVGLEIVDPRKQRGLAMVDCHSKVLLALSKTDRRLDRTRTKHLTKKQRAARENSLAVVRDFVNLTNQHLSARDDDAE